MHHLRRAASCLVRSKIQGNALHFDAVVPYRRKEGCEELSTTGRMQMREFEEVAKNVLKDGAKPSLGKSEDPWKTRRR